MELIIYREITIDSIGVVTQKIEKHGEKYHYIEVSSKIEGMVFNNLFEAIKWYEKEKEEMIKALRKMKVNFSVGDENYCQNIKHLYQEKTQNNMKLETLFQLSSNIVVAFNNIQKLKEEIALQKHDVVRWENTPDYFGNVKDCQKRIDSFQEQINIEEKHIEESLKQIKNT